MQSRRKMYYVLDKIMFEFRREEDSDRNEVYRIHQDAFQRDDEAELVEKLRKNSQFNPNLSFIAVMEKKIVGHILFTPVQISSKSISSLALAPISILREYQRQGIGSQLIEYALNEVKSQGFESVIVLGHEHFYPRFGFLPAKKFQIRAPIPLENENCFMALELKPQALTINDREGIVQYLPEFGI
jgi:predicted N-acetyltransferase YhbS